MTGLGDWEAVNSDYLARGLDWLRRSMASRTGPIDEPWWEDPHPGGVTALPALEGLAERLGLTRFETSTLLLTAGPELDPSLAEQYGAASFALAFRVLPQPTWDVVSPHRPLRYWRLLQTESGEGPLTATALRVEARIMNYLKGLNEIDERLTDWLSPVDDCWGKNLVPSHEAAVHAVVTSWTEPAAVDDLPVVQLVGADARVTHSLAAAAAGRVGLGCQQLHLSRLPGAPAELSDLLRLVAREGQLLPVVLVIDTEGVSSQSELQRTLATVCSRLRIPVALTGPEAVRLPDRRTRLVDAERPTLAEQQRLWEAVLGVGNVTTAARLADHFDLDPGTIADAASQLEDREAPGPLDGGTADRLWDFCCDQARPALTGLAARVVPCVTWDDLVLAEPELRALHQLADQVRGRPTVLREWGLHEGHDRGTGVAALFAGQSGTGKTLAAEVLAFELQLSLCRIDLSGVVSKYIGETERNLRQVFDAAERGGVLLFFDEADALFGRRSEVNDSHDRYANIEVNYLLQRMESFRGLVVLATNHRSALDTAFTRRLRTVITFPFPGLEQRRRMWARAFPAQAPVGVLDLDRLADLPATGAMIRNVALNAACCAAGRGEGIEMSLVLDMAQAEFRKLDLPLPPTLFADAKGRP